jgi:uncharacterized protein YndB with AHSA1/START domain
MTEMDDQITGTDREVGDFTRSAREGHTVVLRRTYDAPIEDVWSACTEAERLGRWFLPVTGDLRLGGHYQLEGNAGGEILVCEPPRRLVVTWIYGDPGPDPFSEVEVQLSPTGGGTLLELEHRAIVEDDFWKQFGPGAVGIGWDLTLLGLAAYLQGTPKPEGDLLATPEGHDFVQRSAEAWRISHTASGADPAFAAETAERTAGFYTAPPPEGHHGSGAG